MVNKEEITNLANLARIKISDEEALSLATELDSILDYIGQIKEAEGGAFLSVPVLKNVMREDVVTNKEGEYTEDILNNAPSRNKNYLEVKKIL